jgi:hypothetical protein
LTEAKRAPVLFLIFNRPDSTEQVFEAIKRARPPRLYVAADGPRSDRNDDRELCAQARVVVEQIDWPCEVRTLFRDKNLGCMNAVSSAIDWFFETEEEGIILEDDCLPHPDFFRFCEVMLSEYRDNERLMHIAGANFQQANWRGDGSYYFSRYNHIWGWATWKRAWESYDVHMSTYSEQEAEALLKRMFDTGRERRYWMSIFSRLVNGEIGTWDYQWTYAIWQQDGLAIIPNVNLVTNLGFDNSGTHTAGHDVMGIGRMPMKPLGLISHPSHVQVDRVADRYALNNVFFPTFWRYCLKKLQYMISK